VSFRQACARRLFPPGPSKVVTAHRGDPRAHRDSSLFAPSAFSALPATPPSPRPLFHRRDHRGRRATPCPPPRPPRAPRRNLASILHHIRDSAADSGTSAASILPVWRSTQRRRSAAQIASFPCTCTRLDRLGPQTWWRIEAPTRHHSPFHMAWPLPCRRSRCVSVSLWIALAAVAGQCCPRGAGDSPQRHRGGDDDSLTASGLRVFGERAPKGSFPPGLQCRHCSPRRTQSPPRQPPGWPPPRSPRSLR
jgi:hypothetical protein